MRTLILFHILMTLSIANPLTDLFSVTPKAEVFSITPIEIVLSQESQFILKGKALTSNINLEINGFTNCQNTFNSSNEVHFLCTAQSVGRKLGIIKDDTNEIYRFYLDVKTDIIEQPKPEIVITPLEAELNQLTTFTIQSTNSVDLPDTLAFWTDQCRDVIPLDGTNRQKQFSCTPSYSAGSKYGLVKDKSGGNILKEFNLVVKDDYRKYINIHSFSPREVYLNEETNFTILGENLPDNLGIEIDGCSNIQKSIESSWQLVFSCTPSIEGNKIATLRNQTDNLIVANLGLNVNEERVNDFSLDTSSVMNLTVEQNSTFSLPLLAKYNGNTKEMMYPNVSYYFSTDTILDSNDQLISTTSAYLNETTTSSEVQEPIYVSNNVEIGDYYIISIINEDIRYPETNKANNQKYQKITVLESSNTINISLPSNYTIFKNDPLILKPSTSNIKNESETTYSWNFGDGTTGTGKMLQHTYTTAGTYTAQVTLNYQGITKTATTQVQVKEPTVSTQKDITNWKQLVNAKYSDITFSDGRFVAVGGTGNIATSTDGVNWQTITYSKQDDIGDLYAVTYGNGKWVAVGGKSSKGVRVVSSDGINWTVLSSYPVKRLKDVHFANGLFVCVGEGSLKYSSSNGENWSSGYFGTIIDGVSADFTSVTYDSVRNKWIAVGTQSGDLIFTSSDGDRWDENSFSESSLRINGVDSHNGRTIAVGYNSSSREGIILTSNDGGSTWNREVVINSNPLVAINYTVLGWLASVGNGKIVSSSDGLSWRVEESNRNLWCTSFIYVSSLNKLLATGHGWNIYEAQPINTKQEFRISLSVHDGGTVTYDGGSCSDGSCTPILANEGDTVNFEATPDSGYKFKYWLGDCYGDGECSLNISDNKRIEAHFAKVTTLTVSKPLDGYVMSSDENIKCGESFNQCSYSYIQGNSVQLTYYENNNSVNRFFSWYGDSSSTNNMTTIVLDEDKSISINTKINQDPIVTIASELNVTKGQSSYLDFLTTDVEGDIVEVSITQNPRLGTITLVGDRVMYIPSENFGIGDGFSLEFSDGHGSSIQKTVKVNELVINTPPIMSTDSNLTILENNERLIQIDITDPDLEFVSTTIITPPSYGKLEFYTNSMRYARYVYTPNENYIGFDDFIVKADDGNGGTFYKTIGLEVIKNSLDTDNDTIPDEKEVALRLNPNSNDSDGDGILDSEEIGEIDNPRDTDGDGTIDALDEDSDNDGVSDKDEVQAGTNPKDKNDHPTTGLSQEQKAMFMILLNRSNQLNKDSSSSSSSNGFNIPVPIILESLRLKEEKK